MTSGIAGPSGISFGPTSSGKHYISLHRHRGSGTTKHKSTWIRSFPPKSEFGLFCSADDGNWKDGTGNYWGAEPGAPVLGVDGERLAKFPMVTNRTDPWHGFPFTLIGTPRAGPSDETVDAWVAATVITEVVASKIRRRRV